MLLRKEGVTFQRLKTWKASKDPRYADKKARAGQLYAIADREVTPDAGDPEVIFCVDEFRPLNLQPRPGRQRAAAGGKTKEPGRAPRRRMRVTYTRHTVISSLAGLTCVICPLTDVRAARFGMLICRDE